MSRRAGASLPPSVGRWPNRARRAPQPARRSAPAARHVQQPADNDAAAMCALPRLQPPCWRTRWPTPERSAGAARAPQGSLHRSSATGSRPAQTAQGRQDLADAEAAVVDGDPVHGTRALLFEPEAFVERLCALIWKPRVNTVHYHGVFASGSAWRAEVVPDGVRRQKRARLHRAQGTRLDFDERWMPWLSMLSHVFGHDERCPACGAKRWVYDVVLGPWPVRRELLELGIDRSP